MTNIVLKSVIIKNISSQTAINVACTALGLATSCPNGTSNMSKANVMA